MQKKTTRSPTPVCINVLVAVLLIIILNSPFRTHANVFEPIGTAIFPVKPLLTICEASGNATSALW